MSKGLALALAAKGYCVHPCGPNKRPLLNDWPNQASCDPEQVERMWAGDPEAMVGIHPGKSGLVVVDLDVKNGKDGIAEMERLGLSVPVLEFWDEVPGVTTPSGGKHLYFRQPKDFEVKTAVDDPAPGIDLRGKNGHVVAPGNPGYVGELPDAQNIRPHLPPALWHAIRDRKMKPVEKMGNVVEASKANIEDVERVCQNLLDLFEPVGEGGRNNALFGFACDVKDTHTLGPDYTLGWLRQANANCTPMLSEDELTVIARSAHTNCQSEAGCKAPLSASEAFKGHPVAAELPQDEHEPFTRLYGPDELGTAFPPFRMLVEGLVPVSGYTLLVGAFNAGKTVVSVDLGLSIAYGEDWMFHPLVGGARDVIFLAGEAEDVTAMYVLANAKHRGRPVPPNFLVGSRVPDLTDPTQVASLARQAVEVATTGNGTVIICDSWSRMAGMEDRNNESQVQRAVATLEELSRHVGGPIIVLGHPTKSETATRPRSLSGSQQAINSANSMLTLCNPHATDVEPSKASADGRHHRRLEVTRCRGVAAGADRIDIELTSVMLDQGIGERAVPVPIFGAFSDEQERSVERANTNIINTSRAEALIKTIEMSGANQATLMDAIAAFPDVFGTPAGKALDHLRTSLNRFLDANKTTLLDGGRMVHRTKGTPSGGASVYSIKNTA